MFPYFELFGTKIYSTGLGIVLSCLAFLITAYFLCKRYNQEFLRLFNGLPWLLVAVYVGGLYLSFVLGIGLLLGDNFVGKPYDWAVGVRALIAESSLVKYGTVYPIGLFLSLGALILNVVITFWKFIAKKAGLWIWGFILLFVLFIGLLPFWNYPAHGVWSVFGLWTLDLNYYVFWFLIIYFLLWNRRLKKPY